MSIKIAHVSDIHVRKLKYHKEYRVVFERLYEKLREIKPDIIINTGDTFHTKLDMSPEAIRMMSKLFMSLSDIAPYYMIAGNHDMNLKNSSRLDALTPIVDNLTHKNLHYEKYSNVIEVAEGVDLHVLSIVDPENWQKTLPSDRTNIALYHGSVVGAATDSGWLMTHGDIDIETLEEYDYGLLGDIHKTHQKLDKAGKCAYPGSLIQQNHGESRDKGFLLWEIEDKENFTCRHIPVTNPKPFITIPLTLKGRMPRKIDVPIGARLRLVSANNLPLNVMRKAMDVAKHRFKPESISFLNRASGERGNVQDITDGLKSENLRDPKVQEELISEYLKDFQTPSDTLEKVYELNGAYNKIIEEKEEIARNVSWKIKSFEFDNLFNYGEENSVNFERLSGIVGIFGKNFSGKSSIVDAALYTLFNTTSKNERKNLNVINQNKEFGHGKLVIEANNKAYTIERTSTKYIKRLKGEETFEAKTDLNFEVYDKVTDETHSLNGLTRNETDANIRKHFGTIDDFMVSSLASQHGALAFIDEGSTRRKEIIAKFLDLEIFEQKFRMAKDDSIEAKAMLKKHESKNYAELIDTATALLSEQEESSITNIQLCSVLKQQIRESAAAAATIEEQIANIPTEFINIRRQRAQQKLKTNTIGALTNTIAEQASVVRLKQIKHEVLTRIMSSANLEMLLKDKEKIQELSTHIASLNQQINVSAKKEELLNEVPCGTEYLTCKFICDAHDAVSTKATALTAHASATTDLSSLNPEQVETSITKYESILSEIAVIEKEISELRLLREQNKNSKTNAEHELKEIAVKIKAYEDNKEVIENLENLIDRKKEYTEKTQLRETELSLCETDTLEIVKLIGSCEQKIETLREQEKEHIDLQRSYTAYDLFMRCMHPNGIAYDVIKKKIPIINQEIAKVLANIVEFEVFFESSGNKFDIFIKHPQFNERPIEMASGAEKTMAAMAIRLSLLSVSSLPKSDLFILDEPGTALDEENMEGFIRILELIKVYFKNVLLISHLDSLKDCVDMQIVIEKKDGYARVNQ